jgi:hypothetical protein
MRETAALAAAYGVGLHTHLAESDNDVAYSREQFGCTPAEYAERTGWTGAHVWHAHCVKLDAHGIDVFARTGTGIAHCPSSNMRLASGIAPVRRMLDAGVAVGSASTARRRTIPRICWPKRGRRCCCSAWATTGGAHGASGAGDRDPRWRARPRP